MVCPPAGGAAMFHLDPGGSSRGPSQERVGGPSDPDESAAGSASRVLSHRQGLRNCPRAGSAQFGEMVRLRARASRAVPAGGYALRLHVLTRHHQGSDPNPRRGPERRTVEGSPRSSRSHASSRRPHGGVSRLPSLLAVGPQAARRRVWAHRSGRIDDLVCLAREANPLEPNGPRRATGKSSPRVAATHPAARLDGVRRDVGRPATARRRAAASRGGTDRRPVTAAVGPGGRGHAPGCPAEDRGGVDVRPRRRVGSHRPGRSIFCPRDPRRARFQGATRDRGNGHHHPVLGVGSSRPGLQAASLRDAPSPRRSASSTPRSRRIEAPAAELAQKRRCSKPSAAIEKADVRPFPS